MINKPVEAKTRKNEVFGYRSQFSGLAIVVYRDTEGYKLQILQDMGTKSVWAKFPEKSYKEGQNGCTIPRNVLDAEFQVNLKVEKNKLSIVYGNKARSM